jgi:hypothetical protein
LADVVLCASRLCVTVFWTRPWRPCRNGPSRRVDDGNGHEQAEFGKRWSPRVTARLSESREHPGLWGWSLHSFTSAQNPGEGAELDGSATIMATWAAGGVAVTEGTCVLEGCLCPGGQMALLVALITMTLDWLQNSLVSLPAPHLLLPQLRPPGHSSACTATCDRDFPHCCSSPAPNPQPFS